MIEDSIVKPGEHCWALLSGELLIVLKDTDGEYSVCGYWEGCIFKEQLQLIKIITRPGEHIDTKLYYS